MSCCGIKGCGRIDLDEPGPGLELYNGKYSCTLCVVNPTRFAQPDFRKNYKPKPAKPLAGPAKPNEIDLYGERDD